MWFQLASHCTSYKAWNATRAKVVACQADVSVFLSFLQSWSDTLSIQMQCLQNWALLFFITLCPLVLHYLGSGATLYLSYRILWLEIFVYCPNCHRSKKEKKKKKTVWNLYLIIQILMFALTLHNYSHWFSYLSAALNANIIVFYPSSKSWIGFYCIQDEYTMLINKK